ncbi:hypothetical protein OJ253_1039 [Cryptosporidium canis]|uniref:ER membrane protein complex subunit 7 beta-sandwich domain-containing protein n=1 Tax=Cryptosporidium canis TaxID=195482 RepID=A0A9D5DI51_9CRYT|nr:hypothetical protein OJ253_1039 [Cryptosporidium canis]
MSQLDGGKVTLGSSNLPKGEYLLRVVGTEHVYDSYVLQVVEQETKDGTRLVCRKFIFDYKTGLPGEPINSYVLNIKPLYSTVQTDTESRGLGELLSLLKNPLVLISAVSLGITLVLPMLQDSLDAEAMDEITGSVPGGRSIVQHQDASLTHTLMKFRQLRVKISHKGFIGSRTLYLVD